MDFKLLNINSTFEPCCRNIPRYQKLTHMMLKHSNIPPYTEYETPNNIPDSTFELKNIIEPPTIISQLMFYIDGLKLYNIYEDFGTTIIRMTYLKGDHEDTYKLLESLLKDWEIERKENGMSLRKTSCEIIIENNLVEDGIIWDYYTTIKELDERIEILRNNICNIHSSSGLMKIHTLPTYFVLHFLYHQKIIPDLTKIKCPHKTNKTYTIYYSNTLVTWSLCEQCLDSIKNSLTKIPTNELNYSFLSYYINNHWERSMGINGDLTKEQNNLFGMFTTFSNKNMLDGVDLECLNKIRDVYALELFGFFKCQPSISCRTVCLTNLPCAFSMSELVRMTSEFKSVEILYNDKGIICNKNGGVCFMQFQTTSHLNQFIRSLKNRHNNIMYEIVPDILFKYRLNGFMYFSTSSQNIFW